MLLNVEGYFLYPSFVGISQRIFWQSVCFRCFIRYHGWFSSADLDDLCYGRQSFLIRQLLAVNLLPVGTVNTSLDGPLTLDSRSYDLTTSFWNLICILLVNRKINLFYSNLIICSQFQLRVLLNRRCFWSCAIFCQFWNFVNRRCFRSCTIFYQFWSLTNWRRLRTSPIFCQFWNLLNWRRIRTGAIFCQFWNFVNWRCFRTCAIFCQFWSLTNRRRLRTSSVFCQFWCLLNWRNLSTCALLCQFWKFMNWRCIRTRAIFCQFWNFVNWSFFWYRVSWSCSN